MWAAGHWDLCSFPFLMKYVTILWNEEMEQTFSTCLLSTYSLKAKDWARSFICEFRSLSMESVYGFDGEGNGNPLQYPLPGKSHGWRSLVGYSPWGREELDTTEQLPFHFSLSCIAEGNGNPLQCSCLENPRHGRAWWAAICVRTESDRTEVT